MLMLFAIICILRELRVEMRIIFWEQSSDDSSLGVVIVVNIGLLLRIYVFKFQVF